MRFMKLWFGGRSDRNDPTHSGLFMGDALSLHQGATLIPMRPPAHDSLLDSDQEDHSDREEPTRGGHRRISSLEVELTEPGENSNLTAF